MAAVAPAWPFPSASVPAVQEGAAPSTSSSGRLPDSPGTTSAPVAALIVLCSGPGPERRPSSPSSTLVLAPSATQARRPTPQTIPSAEAQGQAEALVSKNLPRAVLDLKRRFDEHEAQTKRSFVSLQGQLSKLTDMFSSLTNSMVLSSTSSTTTAPTPSSGSTTMEASAPSLFCVAANSPRTSGGSCFGASSSAYAVPQVFDKMLTPSSGFENCFAHPNQIPSSYVQGGSTNFREQNIDGLPQTYGLHNLICRTVVRADGTEHIYYALPGHYPLERATPEPLFSNESVGVFASKPGQQPYKEEHQEDVQDFSLEVQQQDDEKACNVPVLKTSDSVVTSSSKLSSALVLRGLRWLWDPGAAAFLMTPLNDGSSNDPIGNEHVGQLVNSTGDFFSMVVYAATYIPNFLGSLPLYMLWDPGGTEFHIMFRTAADATKLECTDVYKYAMVQSLCATTTVQVTGCMHYIASNGINHVLNTTALIMQSAVLKTEYQGMRYVWASSLEKGRLVQWDPGIEFVLDELWWLSKGTGHVFRHLLAVKFGSHTCTYFGDTAASRCCPPANLIPHRRKFAVLPQFCHSILLSSVVCVWDPGIALVYQQSVQMNYIARNLLSSHNYLQILEMDIIFITFLPP